MEAKKKEGNGAVMILYAVFLTLGVLTMSFGVYDRFQQKKKEKAQANNGK